VTPRRQRRERKRKNDQPEERLKASTERPSTMRASFESSVILFDIADWRGERGRRGEGKKPRRRERKGGGEGWAPPSRPMPVGRPQPPC